MLSLSISLSPLAFNALNPVVAASWLVQAAGIVRRTPASASHWRDDNLISSAFHALTKPLNTLSMNLTRLSRAPLETALCCYIEFARHVADCLSVAIYERPPSSSIHCHEQGPFTSRTAFHSLPSHITVSLFTSITVMFAGQ